MSIQSNIWLCNNVKGDHFLEDLMEEAPGDMGRSRSVRVLPLSRLVSWSNSRRFCSVMRWGWGALYRAHGEDTSMACSPPSYLV